MACNYSAKNDINLIFQNPKANQTLPIRNLKSLNRKRNAHTHSILIFCCSPRVLCSYTCLACTYIKSYTCPVPRGGVNDRCEGGFFSFIVRDLRQRHMASGMPTLCQKIRSICCFVIFMTMMGLEFMVLRISDFLWWAPTLKFKLGSRLFWWRCFSSMHGLRFLIWMRFWIKWLFLVTCLRSSYFDKCLKVCIVEMK